jgi:hypothetical protein
MYIYNVTLKVEVHRVEEWLQWMREKHIPEVMATNYFTEYRMCRLLDDAGPDGETFVMQYTCKTIDDFLQYKITDGPYLQKQHTEKFGDDVAAFRTVMEIL